MGSIAGQAMALRKRPPGRRGSRLHSRLRPARGRARRESCWADYLANVCTERKRFACGSAGAKLAFLQANVTGAAHPAGRLAVSAPKCARLPLPRRGLQVRVPARRCGPCALRPATCGIAHMKPILFAALLASLPARAEDTRVEALRVEPTPTAVSTTSVSAAPADAASSDKAASERSPVPYAAERSNGWGWPVHAGAMVGLSVPRPLDAEVYVRAFG